jgi:hypothetical protein
MRSDRAGVIIGGISAGFVMIYYVISLCRFVGGITRKEVLQMATQPDRFERLLLRWFLHAGMTLEVPERPQWTSDASKKPGSWCRSAESAGKSQNVERELSTKSSVAAALNSTSSINSRTMIGTVELASMHFDHGALQQETRKAGVTLQSLPETVKKET